MTRDNIIRLTRQVGGSAFDHTVVFTYEEVRRFMDLVAAAEREKVARWMRSMGYATGHGDTTEDLLKELRMEIVEQEREACARVCDKIERRKWETVMNGGAMQGIGARDCAAAIRARGTLPAQVADRLARHGIPEPDDGNPSF